MTTKKSCIHAVSAASNALVADQQKEKRRIEPGAVPFVENSKETTKMNLPTQKQIDAGQNMASILYDVAVELALGEGVESANQIANEFPEYTEIIKLFIEKKIVSVTGIYMAMESAKE